MRAPTRISSLVSRFMAMVRERIREAQAAPGEDVDDLHRGEPDGVAPKLGPKDCALTPAEFFDGLAIEHGHLIVG